MQKTRTFIGSTTAFLVALMMVVSIPVFAQNGSDDGNEVETTSASTSSSSSTETHSTKKAEAQKRLAEKKTKHENETETEVETESSDDSSSEDVHSRGAKLLAAATAKQKGKKAKTAEERKKICESHKSGLNTKFTRISTNSDKIQAKIDGALKKAQDYKTNKNIELANYDTLLAAATAAQSESAAAIATLKTVTPTVDCNSTSVASDVATFKAAATTTRDKLKAYRTSVKALLIALSEANKAAATTTEGGN